MSNSNSETIALHDIQIEEGISINKKLLKQTKIFNIEDDSSSTDEILAKYNL